MKLCMSNAQHLQTDGWTKATNQVVEMVLRCTLHNSSKATHQVSDLSLVEYIINSSPSLSTGYTPFYLDYGYYPTTPLNLIQDSDTTVVEEVNSFVQQMEQIFNRACQML